MSSNYSFETSLPAFQSCPDEKKKQADMIYELIQQGADNLLKLAELTGLEQGRISARISDLIEERKVRYAEEKIVYKKFKRKKICLAISPAASFQQSELF
jgi:hypothetical protein